jgi:hypothetical protein
MGQMYLQRFSYRDGLEKSELDRAWGEAFKAFAQAGNWGGIDKGVTHHHTYGTGWGGYILIEVDDPDAFQQYQAFHLQTYGHVVVVTWEPLFDMDATFESTIQGLR